MNHITCKCGLRKVSWGTEVWIESPRTGAKLALSDGWWMQLPKRFASRVIAAAAVGVHTLSFSADELREFKRVWDRWHEATRPKEYSPTIRTGRYSRMYNGR